MIFRSVRHPRLAGVTRALLIAAFVLATGLAAAAPLYFLRDGGLIARDDSTDKTARELWSERPITEFHGVAESGAPVVSLGGLGIEDGYVIRQGVDIAILNADGSTETVVARNAVRAYPSPSGKRIAILPAEPIGDVAIWENGEARTVPFANRVTLVAWAPDERKVCVTAYPPDWTPYKANNPESEKEFFRLLNSDLYIIDLESGATEQLTDAPGYDYSAVFAPDGRSILFISSRAGRGAFYSIDLASREVRQLTNLEPGSYDVPVGRSDTFVWLADSNTILYEAQEAHKVWSVRTLKPDGSGARNLGLGSQVRATEAGAAFLAADGTVKELPF